MDNTDDIDAKMNSANKKRKRLRREGEDEEEEDDDSVVSNLIKAATVNAQYREKDDDDDDEEEEDDDDDEANNKKGKKISSSGTGKDILGDFALGGGNNNNYDDEDEDGEDLLENAEKDYRQDEILDNYDMADFDEGEYEPLSMNARKAAEALMKQRDKEEARRGVRLPGLLQDEDGGGDESDDEEVERRREQRRARFENAADNEAVPQEPPKPINLEQQNGIPIRELIQRPEVDAEIRRQFSEFLTEYIPDPIQDPITKKTPKQQKTPIYIEAIKRMCAANYQSLYVSFADLMPSKPTLAAYAADAPAEMIKLFDPVATKLTLELYPEYSKIHNEIHVRLTHFPMKDTLRDLRTLHLNCLVCVPGVVTRRSAVMPRQKKIYFSCRACNASTGPYDCEGSSAMPEPPSTCFECQSDIAQFKVDLERSVYGNYQRITLQEAPGSVPAGRIPRYKEVILTDDLVDQAKPGEHIEVTGIYQNSYDRILNTKQGFPVFHTEIHANFIDRRDDSRRLLEISEQDKVEMRKLAKDPRIVQRIISSIAPSIYGQEHVKRALALALFSGNEKFGRGNHRIRGDVNVLLLGDPGTAKSQCLKYVERIAPRAVFTTGKGASAVGLTAAVHKDPVTREWTLEGGALVLADRGVCLIDEFDKMNDQDRTSIHEAMEQQTISISKAGIVTQLRARCSIIAAANPINGRYDSQRSLAENVELTDPILQRFDILCVLQDTIDRASDERLAKFVVSSHVRSHPEVDDVVTDTEAMALGENVDVDASGNPIPRTKPSAAGNNQNVFYNPESSISKDQIPQDLLQKYILYARTLRVRFQTVDRDKLSRFYVDLRRESTQSGGVPVAVRHLESIIRIAESFARMHLREIVRDDDLDAAISVMANSFIQAQKFSVCNSLTKKFRNYLSHNHRTTVRFLLDRLVEEEKYYLSRRDGKLPNSVLIPIEKLQERAREFRIYDIGAHDLGYTIRNHSLEVSIQAISS